MGDRKALAAEHGKTTLRGCLGALEEEVTPTFAQ